MKYVLATFLTVLLIAPAVSAQQSDSSELTLEESEEINVYAPNAFSPNSDGVNDVWYPVISGDEVEEFELTILDRGGREVYYSTNPTGVWTGDTSGNSYLGSPNVFVYFMKVKPKSSIETLVFKGHITSVR